MLPECVSRVGRAFLQILVELELLAQLFAPRIASACCRSRSQMLPPSPGFARLFPSREKDSVRIGENHIFVCHCDIPQWLYAALLARADRAFAVLPDKCRS